MSLIQILCILILWVLLLLTGAVCIVRTEKGICSILNSREVLDINYWYELLDIGQEDPDKETVRSVLKIFAGAFGVDYRRFRFDDRLAILDWPKSYYAHVFGDSMLDAAIEELSCSHLWPAERYNQGEIKTIGDIMTAVLRNKSSDSRISKTDG